jgi:hypothetical protein
MDRERLKEVHQTDLTESRVNEDFLDWLKNKGPSWLLVVLIAVCVYLGITRYKQHQIQKRSEAWKAFFEANLPESYEDVAREFGGIGQMASISRLQAADELLASIQRGARLGATVNLNRDGSNPLQNPIAQDDRLDEETRKLYVERADRFYDEVVADDSGEPGITLLVVNALYGKAAIAECRGEAEAARDWYRRAGERAKAMYPGLAEQAEARAASVGDLSRPTALPVDEALRDILLPEETGG